MAGMRDLLERMGRGKVPAGIRPYTAPLTRSIASGGISPLVPSIAAGVTNPAEHFATEDGITYWTPWIDGSANDPSLTFGMGGILGRFRSPVQTSGPLIGLPTRPALGVAYFTPPNHWKLSGVAEGWSNPLKPNPSQPIRAKLAMGNWTPFGSAGHPLPSNPAPRQMIAPRL